jgi:hypothetical protein
MMDEQKIKTVVEGLQVQCAVAELVVLHLVTRLAHEDARPAEWLRGLADEVHASIDRCAHPHDPAVQVMVEAFRARLDSFMMGATRRLGTENAP